MAIQSGSVFSIRTPFMTFAVLQNADFIRKHRRLQIFPTLVMGLFEKDLEKPSLNTCFDCIRQSNRAWF